MGEGRNNLSSSGMDLHCGVFSDYGKREGIEGRYEEEAENKGDYTTGAGWTGCGSPWS